MAQQHHQQTQPQNIRAQYSEMFRWQREILLAENTLERIASELGATPADHHAYSTHSPEAEDRRLAYFQKLCTFNPEQHRQAHFRFKKEREHLIRDIRTLHQLVSEPL